MGKARRLQLLCIRQELENPTGLFQEEQKPWSGPRERRDEGMVVMETVRGSFLKKERNLFLKNCLNLNFARKNGLEGLDNGLVAHF